MDNKRRSVGVYNGEAKASGKPSVRDRLRCRSRTEQESRECHEPRLRNNQPTSTDRYADTPIALSYSEPNGEGVFHPEVSQKFGLVVEKLSAAKLIY